MSGQSQEFDPMTASDEALRARFDETVDFISGGATRCVSARRDKSDLTLVHLQYEEPTPLRTLTLPPGFLLQA